MGEETTYAPSNFIAGPAVSHHGVRGGCHPLRVDLGHNGTAKRHGRRKRATLCDRVLLQGEVGPCGGVSGALQKKSLSAAEEREDRKSTRLNSSHVAISYAVFCLKKKKKKKN